MASTIPHSKWVPKMSIAEADKIITGPGRVHEIEEVVINGQKIRTYKNLPRNCRDFWLAMSQIWASRDYIVFENDRITYSQMRDWASQYANTLYNECGVRKGDRVAVIMRNYPEFVVSFWATQLIGGVCTMINAWSPTKSLIHCIKSTNPKVIVVDSERADRLVDAQIIRDLKNMGLKSVFVARPYDNTNIKSAKKWKWRGCVPFPPLNPFNPPEEAWRNSPDCMPEDDTTIFFTSGTTGLPKGVLSSHRGFLTNVLNLSIARNRTLLRAGEELPPPMNPNDPQKASLIGVPLFHVTGTTSSVMGATATGSKIVFMHKWDKEEAVQLIMRERITHAGGVPSMIMDLLETTLKNESPLEHLGCGGAPSSEGMPKEVERRFKNIETAQGYGLSETNAVVSCISGRDFVERPTSAGPATPVNEFRVVDPSSGVDVPIGHLGELWIRGPNIMKGYWNDPVSTKKAITPDGWFKSGDIALLDEEGFLSIKDRVKDIIIRGGENIHSVEVENALYADHRLIDAAAVSVPDKRLGELVAAVVSTKPSFKGQVTEASVLEAVTKLLPAHAVPVMVIVQDEMIERNPNGKIVKNDLRKRVRAQWTQRLKHQPKHKKATAKL